MASTLPRNGRLGSASKVIVAFLPTPILATSVSSTVTSTRTWLGSISVTNPVCRRGGLAGVAGDAGDDPVEWRGECIRIEVDLGLLTVSSAWCTDSCCRAMSLARDAAGLGREGRLRDDATARRFEVGITRPRGQLIQLRYRGVQVGLRAGPRQTRRLQVLRRALDEAVHLGLGRVEIGLRRGNRGFGRDAIRIVGRA